MFCNLHEYLPAPFNTPVTLRFDSEDAALDSPDLLLGHTCGYPLMTKLAGACNPVCVAEFDVDGCDGVYYSSWLIAREKHPGRRLNDFFGSTATFNDRDSNSGMNVFRYEVSRLANGAPFFRQTLCSGSHLASIDNLVQGHADIAAIDAVTWHFARLQNPRGIPATRIIGQTISTAGLPFIQPKQSELDPASLTQAMNACLEELPDNIRFFLAIKRFSTVAADAWQSILELEAFARAHHYPELA